MWSRGRGTLVSFCFFFFFWLFFFGNMLSWRRLCLGLDLVAFPITTTIYLSMRAYSWEWGRYLGRMLGAREEGKGKGERGWRRPWSFEFLASFAPQQQQLFFVWLPTTVSTLTSTTPPHQQPTGHGGRQASSFVMLEPEGTGAGDKFVKSVYFHLAHTHTHTEREGERERQREMPRGTKQIPSRHVMSTTYRPGRTLDQSQRTFAFPSDTFVLFSQSSSNSLCVPVTSA